jgi:hypothetical protein
MIRINLRGKLAVGKNRHYMSRANFKPKLSASNPAVQEGQGFKSIISKVNKLNIEPNKKLDKFINFKL